MPADSDRFSRAIAAFDAYNEKDPNTEQEDGRLHPKEVLYARRMTHRLMQFAPEANEAVRLAVRCQHIGRWEIPREKYPMDRKGYLRWRSDEKAHQARTAARILSQCGYDDEMTGKVSSLLLKKELHTNADTQLLEDVACLVFIEFYLHDFAAKHEEQKVMDILRKTISKMSSAALNAVADMNLAPAVRAWVNRAQNSGQ